MGPCVLPSALFFVEVVGLIAASILVVVDLETMVPGSGRVVVDRCKMNS